MRCGALQHEGTILVAQVWRAERWWQRLRGLRGRAPLQPGQGLLIVPCAGVHTFWMRYPLDLVFLDRQGRVLRCRHRVKPWRAASCFGAHATLELPAGTLPALALQPGQVLQWSAAAPPVPGLPAPGGEAA